MDTYFSQVYPNFWYSFIRRENLGPPTSNSGNACLTLAVCAITATLQRDPETFPACAEAWAKDLEQVILTKLESLSLVVLQSLVLLIRYKIETGKFRQAFMLTAIAARAVFAMGLNYEKPELPVMAQELRRRLVWGLSILEGSFAVGVPELHVCARESIHLALPRSDESFQRTLSQNFLKNDLFELFIKVTTIRDDIARQVRPP